MIEGVLRHDTELEVDRQYVDSHGQSEVAFAFSRIAGLLVITAPQNNFVAKLYLPTSEARTSYPNLAPLLRGAIDWDLIARL